MNDSAAKAIELLEQVARGDTDAKRALELWPQAVDDCDDSIANAWHELSHFRADADVLERDQRYASWVRKRCKELASQLREAYRA